MSHAVATANQLWLSSSFTDVCRELKKNLTEVKIASAPDVCEVYKKIYEHVASAINRWSELFQARAGVRAKVPSHFRLPSEEYI